MILKTIASALNGTLIGDGSIDIAGISSPQHTQKNTITLANNKAFVELAINGENSAIVLDKAPESTLTKPVIIVENCQLALITLLELFLEKKPLNGGHHASSVIGANSQIHPSAEIGPNVVIGEHCIISENVTIKANTVLGDNVRIGKGCYIHPNVTIYDNGILGEQCTIHAGCVIGSDGFGYHFNGHQHLKLQHLGNVVIGHNVEIGANSTIDRATLGSTNIGSGTKIDNLVQVAHNVNLGDHNILCAFTGIAGSVTTGNYVVFAAGAGVADHVTIEDNVTVGPRAGIPSKKRLSSNTTWLGSPARPADKAIEQIVSMQRIPGMKKQLTDLQRKFKTLEEKLFQ